MRIMNTKNILSAFTVALGMLLAAACENAEYGVLTDRAFILQTETNANSSSKITVGNTNAITNINVRLTNPVKGECTYRLVYDESALERYNSLNETFYTALPENAFSLSSYETKIDEGQSVSAPVTLTVFPFSDELKNSGRKYALAFRLESVSGNSEILDSGSIMVYALDQVVIQPVVVLNRQSFVSSTFDKEYTLTQWTVEFNVNKDQLLTAIGQGNNQQLFQAKPGEIFTRFGDAPIEGNRLQIKTLGTQMNSQMLFNKNTWYHIAFVNTGSKLYLYVNGVLDNSMDVPAVETKVSEWLLCNSVSYTLGNAMYSEVRFWSKARTQKEIQNNMYACDPASEGLIFYLKCNEGSGSRLEDKSGNGNHAEVAPNAPNWIQDVRIDGK